MLAGVVVVILLVVAAVVAIRSWNRSQLDPMQRVFPGLLPEERYEGTGFQDTRCTRGTAQEPPSTTTGGPPMPAALLASGWDHAWGCVNSGGEPTFTILQFTGPNEVRDVLGRIPGARQSSGTNDGVAYTNYQASGDNGRPYMFTSFPGDSERDLFLIYTYGTDFQDQLDSWIKHTAPLG
ncbi:hypothetical protein [Nocardia ignorata]|uniref:hypothetical protein n=1 Tax=Nocardia ignorata TaxID=145285 RepID=UPI001060EA91|nr:hypothetical protein [Nocardia ignorata]